ncbi:MAG TPA: Gfo/Idh/MocA family oxidoreductase [Candidatus Hydrogenedentes bacterium]|nr:Gfo/Idh/MocA family oxidoreductase [Candidatus Hydrogenedentota bacterium]
MSDSKMTRRAFLAATTTTAVVIAAGGCATKPNTARVVPRKLSPNEKLNIAGIGVGGMGGGDVNGCGEENIVALCDVDWLKAEETFYKFRNAKRFFDFRKMLEKMDKEIDAVTVSTPDHVHAPATYMAMKMGKHVRVQKPMTHTIAEARLMAKTAAETGVTTMMGNQGHCGDGVRELCEMLWAGTIGEVTEAHVWTDRPIWPQGIEKPLKAEDPPDTINWNLWLGPAPVRPYNPGYAPFKWRGWWDFGCGAIGDMACHIMDPAFWSLKLYEAPSYTVEVVQQEGMTKQTPPRKSVIKYTFPARAGMGPVTLYWYDGKIKPPRPQGVPEEQKLGDGDNGSLFIGTKGIMTSGCYGGESRLLPDELMKDFKRPEPTIPRIPDGNSYKHWIECCKKGEKTVSDFSYAGPLTEVANMGNVALLAGKKIEFDVAKMKITNCWKANKYLTKKYRKGWDFMPL